MSAIHQNDSLLHLKEKSIKISHTHTGFNLWALILFIWEKVIFIIQKNKLSYHTQAFVIAFGKAWSDPKKKLRGLNGTLMDHISY